MGTSPKKKSLHSNLCQLDWPQKCCLIIILCVAVYFISKPTSKEVSLVHRGTDHTIKDVRSNNHLSFWNAPKGGEFTPKIAWLMSYPNSGTSFTMMCVERTSNLSTATNYGDEVTADDEYSLSIYPRYPEGPFWEGLSGKLGAIRHLPRQYVLVKTHCGSRCVTCSPQEYVETFESFADACRLSTGRVAPDRSRKEYLYPMDRVKKAIHLIRNPYHNFVARYHLERKNAVDKGKIKDDWVKDHPSDAIGFQRWCYELDEMFKKEEDENFEHDMIRQLRLSPCHAEVYKYIQWHNLAFQLEKKYGIETKVVYYEDYATNFNETVDAMLDFLELPTARHPEEFEPGHEYNTFYTNLDKRRIRLLVEQIASETTWFHIKHYFDRNLTNFFDTDLSEDKVPPDVKKIPKLSPN
jgi:Sulfotransferase domain